jgi:hypothetical protein
MIGQDSVSNELLVKGVDKQEGGIELKGEHHFRKRYGRKTERTSQCSGTENANSSNAMRRSLLLLASWGEKHMRQQRCKTSRPGLTILSLPLLVVLIATPIVAAAAQSGYISIDSAKGQNQAQQDEDRYESHSWAVGQARFESSKTVAQATTSSPLPSTAPPSTRYQPSRRHVVRGASRGAALGAVGGAIAGDAGKGAAAGAAMGGLAGGFRRRDERRQQGSSPR